MLIENLPANVKTLLIQELDRLNKIPTYTDLAEIDWDNLSQGYAFWYKISQGIFQDVPELAAADPILKVGSSTPFRAKPLQAKSAHLIEKIKSIGYINVSAFERSIGTPSGAITKAMHGQRLIPTKYIAKISQTLSKF